MGWDGKLFQNKIRYLFEMLCDEDIDELADYFCEMDADDEKYRSRKNLIRDVWLLQPMKSSVRIISKQNFKDFNITRLNIEGKMVFSYESLFSESLEDFRKRVDRFNDYKVQEPSSYTMEYRYIYYFIKVLNKVVYAKFENIKEIDYKTYSLEVIPSHSNQYYVGNLKAKIKFEENLITIDANNSQEKITLYFDYDLTQQKSNVLSGVGISKMYNIEPRASKALLSKKRLTIDEKVIFYLNSSESEYITSQEPQENERMILKEQFYLDKYYRKIEDLFRFSRKIRLLFKGKITSNIYLHIFFAEFKAFTFMYKKVIQKKKYFVSNKKRATSIFLKSMLERKSSCYIVYPLFGFNGNLFVNTEEVINSINLNIEVAQRGVKIYRIFIVDSLDEIDGFVINTVRKMEEVGIDIRFAIKKDIETLVTSYDFAFPVEKDVVLHKERSKKNNDFSINPDESTIMMYVNNYRLIKEQSLNFEELRKRG